MSSSSNAELISYATDEPVAVGAQLWVDSNLPVTVLRVVPPYDDDDPGAVEIKYQWGAVEKVEPGRVGTYLHMP